MTILTPIWLQAGVYPAKRDRTVITELWPEGLLSSDSFVVTETSGGPTYAVDVSAGRAIIEGDDEPDQGNYLVKSDDVETVAWPAPPGSNSRIDILVLRVNDPNAGGPAGDNATLAVVSGTAAVSPVAPTIPDTAIELARTTVVAAQTVINDADLDTSDRASLIGTAILDDGSVPMAADLDMGTNGVTNLADGAADDDAATWGQVPRGAEGYAQITSGQGGITSTADIGGVTATWTADPSRRYRTTVAGSVVGTSDGVGSVLIRDGSNNSKMVRQLLVDPLFAFGFHVSVVESGLSGSQTRKLSGAFSGAGFGTFTAASSSPCWILVEDIGPV